MEFDQVEDLFLKIDTQGCQNYAARLTRVKQAYQKVEKWRQSVAEFASKQREDNLTLIFTEAEDLVRAAKFEAAVAISGACKALEGQVGVKCITRLINHFNQTATRVSSTENELLSKGRSLLNL